MKRAIAIISILLLVMGIYIFRTYQNFNYNYPTIPHPQIPIPLELIDDELPLFTHVLKEDISIEAYFDWIESLVENYDSLVPYELSEKLVIHANPWIIDSFAHSDYYYLKERGHFVYDQKAWIVIQKGDTIQIPSSSHAENIESRLKSIRIDINLPEFKLRLIQGDSLLYTFPVRIGQHRKKYLASEEREVDLHTIIGSGFVCRFIRSPKYINFSTGEEYKQTRRDDEKITLMPLIPTLDPEINGLCHGQLIHPTTNPKTLGKAYSHGCIGTREGDAWRIYFYSRIGTPIEIRYDLKIIDQSGDSILLPDVYELNKVLN